MQSQIIFGAAEMDTSAMNEQAITPSLAPPNAPVPKRRRRRLLRTLGILAFLLFLLGAMTPWLLSKVGLRDRAINAILASPSVTASSESASFGWFSALSVDGLDLRSANNRFDVRVGHAATEQSPFQLWTSSPNLGTIRVDKVHVRLELPLDVGAMRPGHRFEPAFTAIATDGTLTLLLAGEKEPAVDVDEINMTFRVENTDEGEILTLDPLVVFDRRKLTPKMVKSLIYLIDPTIGDTPHMSGEFTLSLDKLRVPLGIRRDQVPARVEMEGKLVLHNLSTEVKNPMRRAIIQLVADMNGKHASDVVRLAQDTEIRFQVREGRIHHDGLRIGLPDIDPALQITSHGSVGLDKTIDLHIELPRLDKAQRVAKGPAKCRITGTIDKPKITVEDASLVLRQPGRDEPIIAVDNIPLNVKIEKSEAGSFLTVEPVEIFKKSKLSVVTANGLVALIAPDVQIERQLSGEISLDFSSIRIPLGVPRDQLAKGVDVEGKLTLHHVTTEVKKPMWQAIIKLLADMNGKPPSNVVRLAEDSEIKFRLRDGRLHHEGLRIGFPEIDPNLVVTSRGSIGADQTLDLYVELPRLDKAQHKGKGPAKCHITGTIDKPRITVEDASLVLRQPGRAKPMLAVEGMNLTMLVEKSASGPVLVVKPVEVFKNAKVSVVAANGLVSLIAPDVDAERQVTGEMSLALSTIRMPLGAAKELGSRGMEVEGKLTLHHVTTEIKKPMWQAIIKLLADMNGKPPSNVVRLADDSEIKFRIRDGRVHHEGLRIGFPEIDPDLVVMSRGSIGADETLDVHLEFPRLRKDQRDKGPVKCHVTGTLNEPKISVADASLIVQLTDTNKATLTVDNVNLTFGVETTKDGRMLTLAPVTLFEKRKLTPELGDQLLKLIAPTLSELSGVQGEISLSFEIFRVPLGIPKNEAIKRVELKGKLHLHQITVSTKTPMIETTVKVLADMYGKKPSEVVQVVKNAEVCFQVRDGRMHHEGLRLGFPDISPDLIANSRGSVGFDGSLDIVLEVPRLVLKKKDAPDPKSPPPVRFQIKGTIDKPIVTEIKEVKDK
jgi:hypothetical protein